VRFRLAVSTLLLTLALAVTASANPIGTLGVGSSGTMDMTLLSLTWTPDPAALPVPGPPWNGDANSATHLTFAGCTTGNLGDIGCLFLREGVLINNGTPLCGGTNTTCPGGAEALPITTFLQFEAHPNLAFELEGVAAGSPNNCLVNATVTCSIAGSPVVLTPLGSFGTSLSIGMFGLASDTGVGGLPTGSTWVGGFNATIPNMTPAQITAFFCPGGVCDVNNTLDLNSVSGSFSATSRTAPVPEPDRKSVV